MIKRPYKRSGLLSGGQFLIRGVACSVGDNFVIFYYLSASETWPDKRVACDGSLKVGFVKTY